MNCVVEDDTWCIWNASEHGNGQGSSFVSLWEGATVTIMDGITLLAFIAGVAIVWFMYKKGVI